MYFFFHQARYCDDPEQAEVFYRHALVLVPSNGGKNLKFSTHIFHLLLFIGMVALLLVC